MAQNKDLITLSRAYNNLVNYTQGGTFDPLVASLITAISDFIEKWCKRRFVTWSYDELYNGNGDRRMILRQYPIQSVKSVRYRPVTVLFVQNTNMTLIQQARVSVLNNGLALFTMASGVATTTTAGLTYAACPTLQSLATAINAIGSGWTAQVVGASAGDYGLWPSSDLYVPGSFGDALEGTGILQSQGAQNARGVNAELKMHTYELSGYQWDARGWLLRAIPYTDPELLHPEDLIFLVGINNFRVQYTAGYSTVPEAVQEACAEWVAQLIYEIQRDPALQSQAILGGTTQAWNTAGFSGSGANMPPTVEALLAPYRRRSISNWQS